MDLYTRRRAFVRKPPPPLLPPNHGQIMAIERVPPRARADRALARLFRLSSQEERAFEAQRTALENREHFLHDMSILDAKSSALLTHVSIMLAAIAVLLAPNEPVWKWIFTAELVLFSLAGVLLLRCVDILGPPFRRVPADGGIEEYYRAEVQLRRAIFQGTIRAVRFLTVCLIVIVTIRALT